MPESARLALRFDSECLRSDLSRLSTGVWTPHFNASFFEGDWSGIVLRGSASDRGLFAGSGSTTESFTATEALEAFPYFQEVLAAFQCPLKSVRLLHLAAGSVIREHSDADLGEQLGEVRLHVPVVTNSEVEFHLAENRVAMEAGECWYLDLSLPHHVKNRGASERVHLVLDCVLNEWLWDLIGNAKPESAKAAATGADAFQQFAQLVFGDPALQAMLRDIQDLEEFLRQTVRLGEQHESALYNGGCSRSLAFGQVPKGEARLMDLDEDWIPCRVVWEQDGPLVDWSYLRGTRFSEPFFRQTITRHAQALFAVTFFATPLTPPPSPHKSF